MAGTNSQSGVLFNADSATGNTSTGTMFVFTDGDYPGLSTQTNGIPNYTNNMPVLYQGVLGGTDPSSAFKNAVIELTESWAPVMPASALPPALDAYSGIVWWQDRRNSTVDITSHKGTRAVRYARRMTGRCSIAIWGARGAHRRPRSSIKASPATSKNHVTYTSPQIGIAPGNGRLGLNGVIYQPRGAWLYINAGQSALQCTVGGVTAKLPS